MITRKNADKMLALIDALLIAGMEPSLVSNAVDWIKANVADIVWTEFSFSPHLAHGTYKNLWLKCTEQYCAIYRNGNVIFTYSEPSSLEEKKKIITDNIERFS